MLLTATDRLYRKTDRTSSPAHSGNLRNAIDFIVPENIPVLAAANGIVSYVKDDSSIGGPNPIYWNFTNFIAIRHANEEYSTYDHLAPQSSKVKVGQSVSEGQEIAKVGMTGYRYELQHTRLRIYSRDGRS